ncbi:MAG TPA: hypothetical protein VG329_09085, partial [Candidatus Dormibacteraeota bacterium]|nr:hypothetical protein [Candidatus Dormibacteraeota bacterium]
MRWAGRSGRLLFVLLIALSSAGGSATGARSVGPWPPAPDRTVSFLHVGPASGPSGLHQVVDQQGREVLLKGVNVDGITDYFRGGALGDMQA